MQEAHGGNAESRLNKLPVLTFARCCINAFTTHSPIGYVGKIDTCCICLGDLRDLLPASLFQIELIKA